MPKQKMRPRCAPQVQSQRTPADGGGLNRAAPEAMKTDRIGSTMRDSALRAAGVGFEPTNDLDGHCRFSRPAHGDPVGGILGALRTTRAHDGVG